MTIILGTSAGVGGSWADVRAKVRGDLWRPSNGLTDDVVDRGLHAALQEIEAERRWIWNENINATLTVDEAADNVEAPALMLSVTSLSHRYMTGLEPLKPLPLNRVRELSSSSNGSPQFYALSNGRIYFDTLVPAGTQFELVFSGQTPDTVEVARDTFNVTLQKCQQAVIALAASYVALSFLKNEAEAARQRSAYERHLDRMFNREDMQRSDIEGGSVQPDSVLQGAAFGQI